MFFGELWTLMFLKDLVSQIVSNICLGFPEGRNSFLKYVSWFFLSSITNYFIAIMQS